MGGIVSLAICYAAIYRLQGGAHPVAHGMAVVAFFLELWTYGVMWNYRATPTLAPNWTAKATMLATLVGIIMLVYSFFI